VKGKRTSKEGIGRRRATDLIELAWSGDGKMRNIELDFEIVVRDVFIL
jgi:hypothetical protein